jgi:hypothetical protein
MSYVTIPIDMVVVVSRNSDGSRSSLKMADCCRNMQEPTYRIKQWYKSVHCVGYFYNKVSVHEAHATITVNNSVVENVDVIKTYNFYI